jgi:hypothetical protein
MRYTGFLKSRGVLGRALASFTLAICSAAASVAGDTHQLNSSLADETYGITLSVTASGDFSVISQTPAWIFSGAVGAPVSGLSSTTGKDGIGWYQKISFTYNSADGVPRRASIRTYASRPVVVFSTTFLANGANTALFPRISTYPQGMYKFGFNFTYGYQYGPWGQGPDSPWAYFDQYGNSFIVSPASHFPLAANIQDQDSAIVAGINAAIPTLTSGFTQETMLVVGQGINHTWDLWGHAMTDLHHKVRPSSDSDVSLASIGYWTDSASVYYYNYEAAMGYEGTLIGAKANLAAKGIPISHMQLDSWWYPKGSPPAWNNLGSTLNKGQYLLRPDATVLPDGLSGFQQKLDGIPLIVHARWTDPTSPDRQQYTMSGNVPIDPQYWTTLAAYLKSGGVMTYEQDWLASYANTNMNLTDPETYLDLMAHSMANAGITLQYCGQTVGDFLQGSKYSNLTTVRVSQDGFNQTRWDPFLYNSRLAGTLGMFPFADNVYSTDVKSLVLATQSAGILGIGDAIGQENIPNLLQAVRGDGLVVKPDAPMVPMDATYIADAQAELHGAGLPPMMASGYTDHSGTRTSYVFAYSRNADGSNAAISFAPSDLGITGPAYVYNYFSNAGQLVSANGRFSDLVATTGSYYIVAPVGHSKIALLGDTGKFVSLGHQRVPQVQDTGILKVSIQFAAGETGTTIQGYSPSAPVITMTEGTVSQSTYNPVSQVFSITVAPAAGDTVVTLSLSAS